MMAVIKTLLSVGIHDKENILGWHIMGKGHKPKLEFKYSTKIMIAEIVH